MASLKTDSAPLEGALTPNLDRLLRRLGGMLRRNIWLHGLGTALAAGALWLTFMYAADRMLKLPSAIRVINLIILIGGLAWILWRTLFQHTKIHNIGLHKFNIFNPELTCLMDGIGQAGQT